MKRLNMNFTRDPQSSTHSVFIIIYFAFTLYIACVLSICIVQPGVQCRYSVHYRPIHTFLYKEIFRCFRCCFRRDKMEMEMGRHCRVTRLLVYSACGCGGCRSIVCSAVTAFTNGGLRTYSMETYMAIHGNALYVY